MGFLRPFGKWVSCRNYDLRGFEVAGEDRVFHPADKVWLHWQTNEVVISSEKVSHPVSVRYCFRDFQVGTMIKWE